MQMKFDKGLDFLKKGIAKVGESGDHARIPTIVTQLKEYMRVFNYLKCIEYLFIAIPGPL